MDDVIEQILNVPTTLSKTQKKAVLSESKRVKIIAGAGAGKTETITRRILYLLLYKNIDPRNIVAFTFTEKAAQTMKSRIYQRIQGLGKEHLLKNLGEMYVGTIHGFYLRILQERYSYGDYGVLDENQEMAFILRYGYSLGLYNKSERIPYSTKCEQFLKTNSVIYNELIDRKLLKENEPKYYKKIDKYEKHLRENRRLTFDYMGFLAVNEIMKDPDAVDYIEHLIVDEFQDINYSQFQLIELIGKKKSIFVVGDPRQSIYQWRGSDDSYFMKLSEYFSDVEEIHISENRRSGQKIVTLSNSIADKFEKIHYSHMNPNVNSAGIVLAVVHNDDKIEARNIADSVQKLSDDGLDYSDIGILYRSVNTSATNLIKEFKKRKIPYIVGGKIGLFKRDEAQALGRLVSWISADGFWVKDRFQWKDQIRGDDLLHTGLQHWENATGWELETEKIERKLEKWKYDVLHLTFSDYKDILSELLVILGYKNLKQSVSFDATIMANIGRFSGLLGDFEAANRFGGKPKDLNLNKEIKNLSWYINTYATSAYEEQTPENLNSVDAVSIMTVHQAKGLEWPVVFVPSVVLGRFPSSMANRKEKLLVSDTFFEDISGSILEKYRSGAEGERRLFYVATTRAKDALILSRFSHLNGSKKSNSIFLEELELSEVEGNNVNIKTDEVRKSLQEEDVRAFSAIEILDYMRCPYHYRLSTQWNYSQGISPFMGYGETLHFCLRTASELMKRDNIEPEEAIKTVFEDEFFLPFADRDWAEGIRRTAQNQLINYAQSNHDDMLNIDEVETRIEFPIENASIVGKVDVIIRDGEGIEVRDYKTSDKVITEEDSKLQVRLYAIGLTYLGRDVTKGSVVTLDANTKKWNVGVLDSDLKEARKTAIDVIQAIKQKEFNGKQCGFCPRCEYKRICSWNVS